MLLKVVILWRRLVQALSSNSVLQILSSTKTEDSINSENENFEEDKNLDGIKSPLFDSEKQVRIILFKESDLNGRKILFDSKSLKEKEDKEVIKHNIDLHMLEEMVFGSVNMTYWGTTMKIHTIRTPPHLIISLVFPAPLPDENKINKEKELEESDSWHHSSNEIQISKSSDQLFAVAHSIPVDVPGGLSFSNHCYGNKCIISDSLQSTGSTKSYLSLSRVSPNSVSSSLNYSGSFNSLQRRLLRNMATSIEFGLHPKSENLSAEEVKENGQKKVKLGLTIVISMDENPEESSQFQKFFFSHVTIIEGHVLRLKNSISKAYLNRKMSVFLTCEAIRKFHRSLQDLYTAPRLSYPLWLSKMLPDMNHHYLYFKFINQFVSLLDKYERKETNFFVSTLLTAVLTHHLAWVPTVTPTNVIAEDIGNQKNVSKWLELLAKSYPYNPLWVQLGDMYGCLGFPSKLARTIVVGKEYDVINNFLFMLSYFIRCSGIWEQIFEKSIITEENLMPLPTKDISSDNANSETSANIENESKHQAFSTSYFPKRRYSLQDFSKWTQNTKKNINISFENQYDHYGSREMDWKLLQSNLDFEVEPDINPQDNYLHKFDTFPENNIEDTVFLLDENLPYDDSYIEEFHNHKTVIQKHDGLHKSESLMYNLGYNNIDDQLDENHISKQSWNYNTTGSKNNDSLIVNTINRKYKEDNDPIPKVNIETVELNENNRYPLLKSNKNKLCFCQMSMNSEYYKNYTNKLDLAMKCECSKQSESPEKYHQYKLNVISKTALDDGPEEGYHSMEETKITVSKHLKMHFSDNNSLFRKVTELQLPKFQIKEIQNKPSLYRGYGWSLLASTSNHYMTDFCLQGINGYIKEEEVRDDLLTTIECPVLGEPVTEAVGIIADTDKWKVKLISTNKINGDCKGSHSVQVGMSSLVADVCESVLQMHKFNMPPELCVMHLEDRLQELYFRSRFLAEYLCNESSDIDLNKATAALSLNLSDVNLLIAVGTTHTPQLAIFNR